MKRRDVHAHAKSIAAGWRPSQVSGDHHLGPSAPRAGRAARAILYMLLAIVARPAVAVDSSESLISPIVTQGEHELDWQLGAGSPGRLTSSDVHAGLGFGMGMTDHWFTELSINFHKHSGEAMGPDEIEWENVWQLAEQDEWPVDVGLVFSLGKSLSASDGASVRFGPLFQKEFGRFQANFNLLFERHHGGPSTLATRARYQGQIKYRYSRPLEFGVQAFGILGAAGQTWAPNSEQVHRLGPVLMGRFALPQERAISYNAAVLYGTTPHSPDRTLRLQIEYEF